MSNLVSVLDARGQKVAAGELRRKLEQMEPDPPFGYYKRGLAAMNAGNYKLAKEMFAKEVDRAAYYHEFHFWLALAYVGLTSATAIIAKNVAFKEEMDPEMHKILDTITTIFGSRTIEQVSTTEGKDKLKADLIAALNGQLHDKTVDAIYFESFITQ